MTVNTPNYYDLVIVSLNTFRTLILSYVSYFQLPYFDCVILGSYIEYFQYFDYLPVHTQFGSRFYGELGMGNRSTDSCQPLLSPSA